MISYTRTENVKEREGDPRLGSVSRASRRSVSNEVKAVAMAEIRCMAIHESGAERTISLSVPFCAAHPVSVSGARSSRFVLSAFDQISQALSRSLTDCGRIDNEPHRVEFKSLF